MMGKRRSAPVYLAKQAYDVGPQSGSINALELILESRYE